MITSIGISDAKTWPRQPARRLLYNLLCDFCIKVLTILIKKNLSENENHISNNYAWHFLVRNEESRNLMTRNSSQGKQTRKTRN